MKQSLCPFSFSPPHTNPSRNSDYSEFKISPNSTILHNFYHKSDRSHFSNQIASCNRVSHDLRILPQSPTGYFVLNTASRRKLEYYPSLQPLNKTKSKSPVTHKLLATRHSPPSCLQVLLFWPQSTPQHWFDHRATHVPGLLPTEGPLERPFFCLSTALTYPHGSLLCLLQAPHQTPSFTTVSSKLHSLHFPFFA